MLSPCNYWTTCCKCYSARVAAANDSGAAGANGAAGGQGTGTSDGAGGAAGKAIEPNGNQLTLNNSGQVIGATS